MTTPLAPNQDDDRMTSLGLFHTAEAFWLSAMALEGEKVKVTHAAKPIEVCYYHALQLYLKALLRQKHSVEMIREKFGHNTKRLVKEAEALGLVITDEDRDVFSIMEDTGAVIEARYIRTEGKTLPALEALSHTCKRVRDGVGDLLFKAGVPVWL